MDYNRTGSPKTPVCGMTPTSKGTKYPCDKCDRQNLSCGLCDKFRYWFSEKWSDIQKMFGLEDHNNE